MTPRIMAAMTATRPWITFLAVLSFIGAGLVGVAGFAFLRDHSPFHLWEPVRAFVSIIPAIVGVVAASLLLRYRSSLASLQAAPGIEALEKVAERHGTFWRFVGIAAAVSLVLSAMAMVAGFVLLLGA